MARMKTFFTYALIIVAFIVYSNFAADVILNNSFKNLAAATSVTKSVDGLDVETTEVKANKRQGQFSGKVINTSNSKIDKKYIKVSAYDGDILLQTRYLTVNDIEPGESREFTTKFTADGIKSYKVDFVNEVPEERTILDDALDKVLAFFDDTKKNGIQLIDLDDFHLPDWAWLVSIGVVLYAIPSGAIWFII